MNDDPVAMSMRRWPASPRAVALLLALWFVACSDGYDSEGITIPTPIVPAEAASIILSASPFMLPAGGGTSTITAVVLDQDSVPLEGAGVTFNTDVGELDSQGMELTTDSLGVAVDFLTTTESAMVTAASGSVSAQLTVTVG